jgi:glycosyltransferase involved in cell wall biosynthesis
VGSLQRIALVAPFGLRAKGTACARALPLGRALARRGHTVALFVPPYDSPEDAGRCWTDSGVEVINVRLPAPERGAPAWHLRLGWRLYDAVRAWQPDVIHVFKPKGPSGIAGTLVWGVGRQAKDASRGHGAPAVHRSSLVIDSDDWEGPGGWNDDPRSGYTWAQRRFFTWQERYGLSHACAWTVASECLRQRAVAFGAAPERIALLPNGIAGCSAPGSAPGAPGIVDSRAPIRRALSLAPPLSDLPPSISDLESAMSTSPPTAVLYTRFAGVDPAQVAAIWSRVCGEIAGARLLVVGRGIAGEERLLAGEAGIKVLGWVEPERLPALFVRATLAMVPWTDTPANRARSSVKVRELMAAGLAIVAWAVGELPATLGESGLLAPPGDEAGFAAAVVGLLRDPLRTAQLGAAARRRAAALFGWDHLAQIALDTYATAVSYDERGRT